jgi:hypothetical protein
VKTSIVSVQSPPDKSQSTYEQVIGQLIQPGLSSARCMQVSTSQKLIGDKLHLRCAMGCCRYHLNYRRIGQYTDNIHLFIYLKETKATPEEFENEII